MRCTIILYTNPQKFTFLLAERTNRGNYCHLNLVISDKIRQWKFQQNDFFAVVSFARNTNAEKYNYIKSRNQVWMKKRFIIARYNYAGHIYEKNSEADISSNILFSLH